MQAGQAVSLHIRLFQAMKRYFHVSFNRDYRCIKYINLPPVEQFCLHKQLSLEIFPNIDREDKTSDELFNILLPQSVSLILSIRNLFGRGNPPKGKTNKINISFLFCENSSCLCKCTCVHMLCLHKNVKDTYYFL